MISRTNRTSKQVETTISTGKKTAIKKASTNVLHEFSLGDISLRVIIKDGTAWLSAVDVANILSLGNIINLSRHLDQEKVEDIKQVFEVVDPRIRKRRTMVMLRQDGALDIMGKISPLYANTLKRDLEKRILPTLNALDVKTDVDVEADVQAAKAAKAAKNKDKNKDVSDLAEVNNFNNLSEIIHSSAESAEAEFNFNGKIVRIIVKDSKPWFVAKDVCNILGYTNVTKALNDHVDKDERSNVSLGRQGRTNLVNESGLYALILRSRKPEAQPFRRWIASTVLASIRKYGTYASPDTVKKLLKNPELIVSLIKAFRAERVKVTELESQIENDQHKVAFADAVGMSDDCILVGTLAKFLSQNGARLSDGTAGGRLRKIGTLNLFKWMRDNFYLMKAKGERWNLPTQRSIDRGLFKIRESTIMRYEGSKEDRNPMVFRTPVITGKGQRYFIKLFFGEMASDFDMDTTLQELKEIESDGYNQDYSDDRNNRNGSNESNERGDGLND